jgi:hypothetical protein
MREAQTPPEVVQRLLAAAGPNLILVGGQALAFWMSRYDVHAPEAFAFVSRDMDFLAHSAGDKAEVMRLAQVLGGQAVIPHEKALTALVGQAVRSLDGKQYINVDVVFKIYGANTELVRKAAVDVNDADLLFRVMHPMDVLKSRLDNLYGLKEKQTPLGQVQLEAAIRVAQRFQRSIADEHPSNASARSPVLRFAKFIESLALSDAGRKVAERNRIFIADAIEPAAVEDVGFREQKLPQLLNMMSPDRRDELAHVPSKRVPTRNKARRGDPLP